jgi:hypothetical protein
MRSSATTEHVVEVTSALVIVARYLASCSACNKYLSASMLYLFLAIHLEQLPTKDSQLHSAQAPCLAAGNVDAPACEASLLFILRLKLRALHDEVITSRHAYALIGLLANAIQRKAYASARRRRKLHIFSSQLWVGQMPGPPRGGQLVQTPYPNKHQLAMQHQIHHPVTR